MSGGDLVVRPLVAADREAWAPLWAGYLSFYGTELDDGTTDAVFTRLVTEGPTAQFALVASVEDDLVGFAHCGVQHSTWSVAPDCYLEDLFVDPDVRGGGVGGALVDALVATGRERGWRTLHWLTDTDNATARRLYDRVGTLADQVRYTIDLTDG